MIRQILFQKGQNIEKSSQKTKKAQNVVFTVNRKLGFIYYFTASNMFTDNLKLI